MAERLAALSLLLLGIGIGIGTQAQSDYDENSFGPPSQGLPPLAPNGCRAKGFSVTTVNNGQKVCRHRVIFLDQFNELDPTRWVRDVQVSDEQEYEFTVYDRDPANLYIDRGQLHVKASLIEDRYGPDFVMTGSLHLRHCTAKDRNQCVHRASSFDIIPPVQSARVSTRNLFGFRYGTMDIRARMPSGDWVYPIIALRPTSSTYGPGYASGEIRLPYAVGNRPGHHMLTAGIVLQPPGSTRDPLFLSVNYTNTNATVNYQRQFHVYRLKWTPSDLEFFVDGLSIGKLTPPEGGWAAKFDSGDTGPWLSGTSMAPFDQEFYVTIGVGVGGISRFPDSASGAFANKPWKNTSPKAMLNFWKSRDSWRQSWDSPRVEVAFVKIHAIE